MSKTLKKFIKELEKAREDFIKEYKVEPKISGFDNIWDEGHIIVSVHGSKKREGYCTTYNKSNDIRINY